MKQSGSVHTRLYGRATDGSRPPASATPGVPNPLRPSGAGDVPSCDRRERVGRDSPAGQGCPEAPKKRPIGSFEGLRVQPCFFRFRERKMPGRKPRSRHAEAAPLAPPRGAGGGKRRRVRDVRHRSSRRGTVGMVKGFSKRKGNYEKQDETAGPLFMPPREKRRQRD